MAIGAALASLAILRQTEGGEILEVIARYPVPEGATEVAATPSAVWILDPEGSSLTSVDPVSGEISALRLRDPPSAVAASRDVVWVASERSGSLLELDARSGRVLGRSTGLRLPGAVLAVGAHAVWILRETARPLVRVDPDSLQAEAPDIDLGTPVAPDLTIVGDRLWGSNAEIGQVLELDPATGSNSLHGEPLLGRHPSRSIASDRGAIWLSQPTHGSVTKLDADTGAVEFTVSIGEVRSPQFVRGVEPYGLGGGPGGLWVTQPDRGRVVLLDEESGAVRATLALEHPVDVVAAAGSAWVLDRGRSDLVRIDAPPCSESPFIGPDADLRACDLSASVFVGVDLSRADLRWADLSSSALQRVDFTDADLLGAHLRGSALEGATWAGTRCPDGSPSDANGGTCLGHLEP